MTRSRIGAFAGALLFFASPAIARDDVQTDWHRVVTDDDQQRLRALRQSWIDALAQARAAGQSRAIAAQGELFDPDRAAGKGKLPAGDYRCRVFKIGAKAAGNRAFGASPAARCRVDPEGQLLSFHKIGGVQRPVGLLFDDGPYRQIFLGTLVIGDETTPISYGRDTNRDMVGVVERVGPKRWRLALPQPHFESLLDVIELVPVR